MNGLSSILKRQVLVILFFDKPILKCTHTNLVYALLKLLNAVFSNPLVKEYDEKAKQLAKRLEGYKNLLIKYYN